MEQDLWRAVLKQAHDDLRGARVDGESLWVQVKARRSAARWLWSSDFRAVCALADVGADRVFRSFRKALARGGPIIGQLIGGRDV